MKTGNAMEGTMSRALAGWALIAWVAVPAIGVSAAEAPSQPSAGIANCEVTVPAGDYSVVFLDFDVPGAPGELAKWTYHGGLRAGKMRMDDAIGMREPGGISVSGDRLVAYRYTESEREKNLKPFISVYKLTPAKADLLWEVEGGCHGASVPVVVLNKFFFAADLRVIDLATGKVLGQSKGPMPANGGYMESIEDLVLARIDGTHGALACCFYKVAPDGTVRCLNQEKPWSPLPGRAYGGGTSSYHHPMMFPMVDGRMFLRQYEGIYCWDVRKGGGN